MGASAVTRTGRVSLREYQLEGIQTNIIFFLEIIFQLMTVINIGRARRPGICWFVFLNDLSVGIFR